MKKSNPTKKSPPPADDKRTIGGQPENDRDAREAGLTSATARQGGGKTGRAAGANHASSRKGDQKPATNKQS